MGSLFRSSASARNRHRGTEHTITSESVSQSAVPTAANLTLHSKIDFCELILLQLEVIECFISVCSTRSIFGLEFLRQAACAVLAGAAPFTGFWSAFRC